MQLRDAPGAADQRCPQTGQFSCGGRAAAAAARESRVFWISRPGLTAPVDSVLESRELVDPYRTARVQAPSRYSDLCPETKFTAIGKLRRRIVQHDCRINFAQERFGGRGVVGDDCIGMMRSIAFDMRDGGGE